MTNIIQIVLFCRDIDRELLISPVLLKSKNVTHIFFFTEKDQNRLKKFMKETGSMMSFQPFHKGCS